MPPLKVTPAPPLGPLSALYWDSHGVVHGWRPQGTRDWLLLYTETGHCLIRFRGGEFITGPGDVILYQPGTPQDYGQHDPKGRWRHVWAHWVPRAEFIPFLNWPEIRPGIKHLHLPPMLRRSVLKEFVRCSSTLQSNHPQAEFMALNCLERGLLLCSRADSRSGNPGWNPRIQQAVDFLAGTIRQPHLLADTARRFGFSRSLFAALFRRQVGQSPGEYLELQRLHHARNLLAHTDLTLAQIADQTGFSSPFYLSLRFKKFHRQSPRAFRQRARPNDVHLQSRHKARGK